MNTTLESAVAPKQQSLARGVAGLGPSAGRPTVQAAMRAGALGGLTGRSPVMVELYHRILAVASTNATVLLTGETGTGKEVVASTIHDLSARHRAPFVAINCGAISSSLIESELFGHEQASFTGARKHNGVFAQADGGTLLLDEITEMSMDLQVRLLRVLETGRFRRIGGEVDVKTDVRIVAAANRPIEAAVHEGRLREDLFFRLHVFPICVPPLRSRGADVELLAGQFLDALNLEAASDKRFTAATMMRMRGHSWPGNVRDLKHFVQRAFILAEEELGTESLGAAEPPRVDPERVEIRVGSTLASAEKQIIKATMRQFEGDKRAVAQVLGISIKTLYTRLGLYAAAESGCP